MTNCPSEATLHRVGTEAMSEATFHELESHVEQCAECQKVLEADTDTIPRATHSRASRNGLPTLPGLVLERELGRGGACVVYLAWEPVLERHVAVKLFHRNALVDPHARDHWLAEARALSRVPHDQVVAIHRVDENEEWLWLVLEYVPGGTLKDRLTEPIPAKDAARLVETIARAVGYFHTRGVVHLDLKPSNILVDGGPEAGWQSASPKISDFGIARLEGEPGTTETGANGPKGTPSYMAPEQVAGIRGTIGPAADIYALGALLYHLLTGRPPFQGTSNTETFDQVRNQEAVPPRRLNGRIPRDLETICIKCLEKAPAGRYQSADFLASDLRLWLEGRPIKARRVSPIGHGWRWFRRHPAVAGLLILLATTLTAAIIGLFVLLGRVEAERRQLADSNRNANAYEDFCASAATQLALLLETSVHHHGDPSLEKKQATLLRLRNSILELIKRGTVPSSTLATLGREISWALVACDKREDAYDLSRQATQLLERRSADHPNDQQARDYFRGSVFNTGTLAGAAGREEDAFNCFERVATIPWDSEQSRHIVHELVDAHVMVYNLDRRLRSSGQTSQQERAERSTEYIRNQLFGHEFGSFGRSPGTALARTRPLIQLDGLNAMLTRRDPNRPVRIDELVAQWLTVELDPFSSPRDSSNFVTEAQDAEDWSVALIAKIRERCSKLEIDNSIELSTLGVLFENAVHDAASLRKRGRLDDANTTAARMVATAQRLVHEYPNDPRSHRLASEAHDQIKENANKLCLTVELEPVCPPLGSSIDATQMQDPGAWTVALVSKIRERCAKLGIDKSIEIATVRTLFGEAFDDAALLRKRGRLDIAKAAAERMVALSQWLVREYPANPQSHLLASDAYHQIKKNAFAAGDSSLAIESLGKAIEAGKRALALNPGSGELRESLDNDTEQLESVKADRKAKDPSMRPLLNMHAASG
jgi:tRNA A-37 threonylcarbamoyl transferase component Bud32/tetratricopeptide (TPR) repeat protein